MGDRCNKAVGLHCSSQTVRSVLGVGVSSQSEQFIPGLCVCSAALPQGIPMLFNENKRMYSVSANWPGGPSPTIGGLCIRKQYCSDLSLDFYETQSLRWVRRTWDCEKHDVLNGSLFRYECNQVKTRVSDIVEPDAGAAIERERFYGAKQFGNNLERFRCIKVRLTETVVLLLILRH